MPRDADSSSEASPYTDEQVSGARFATNAIRSAMSKLATRVEELVRDIVQAEQEHYHLVLGYRSWTEYVAVEFIAFNMHTEDRRLLIRELVSMGMSTRAIAPIVGASHQTVMRHAASTGPDGPVARPPTVTSLDGRRRPSAQPPRPPAPVSKPTRRAPLPDAYRATLWELDKALRKAEALHQDDRFSGHLAEYGKGWRNQLSGLSDRMLALTESTSTETAEEGTPCG